MYSIYREEGFYLLSPEHWIKAWYHLTHRYLYPFFLLVIYSYRNNIHVHITIFVIPPSLPHLQSTNHLYPKNPPHKDAKLSTRILSEVYAYSGYSIDVRDLRQINPRGGIATCDSESYNFLSFGGLSSTKLKQTLYLRPSIRDFWFQQKTYWRAQMKDMKKKTPIKYEIITSVAPVTVFIQVLIGCGDCIGLMIG